MIVKAVCAVHLISLSNLINLSYKHIVVMKRDQFTEHLISRLLTRLSHFCGIDYCNVTAACHATFPMQYHSVYVAPSRNGTAAEDTAPRHTAELFQLLQTFEGELP